MKQKSIPLRKCTGCQEMKDKRTLVRVVRSENGEFSVDFTGKKPGRGAYICPNLECLEKAKNCLLYTSLVIELSFSMKTVLQVILM